MKRRIVTLILVLAGVMMSSVQLSAQSQNNEKPPTPEELAAKEAERLETLLKLEDWQVFYVDSILNNDYRALQAELNSMGQARVANSDIYIRTRDKWAEQMFVSMKKVFNEEQWAKFLKSGAGKEKKARDKRAAKIAAAAAKNQGN